MPFAEGSAIKYIMQTSSKGKEQDIHKAIHYLEMILERIMRIPKFEAQTEWVKPTEFPDLRQVDEIGIDLETKDPGLKERGSGSVIGNGDVVGIAVATAHYKGYFPIAHEGGGNMDRKQVLNWLQDILNAPSTKIFHNAIYDVCWLKRLGLKIQGDIVCTMIAIL